MYVAGTNPGGRTWLVCCSLIPAKAALGIETEPYNRSMIQIRGLLSGASNSESLRMRQYLMHGERTV